MIIPILKVCPRKALSHLVGQVVHLERPRVLATFLKKFLIKSLKLDTQEAEHETSYYPSFGKYFARRLKPGMRPIGEAALVSPCDGRLDASGPIERGLLIQCKGLKYSLNALLQNERYAPCFKNGAFATIYLAPHNYHRVHHAMDGLGISSQWIEGDLWPVNSQSVQVVPELFCVNERVISLIETEHGMMAMIMVGATNVGKMEIFHWDEEKQKSPPRKIHDKKYLTNFETPLRFTKGEEFGVFHMGSTVILLFSEELCRHHQFKTLALQNLRCGQNLI